MCRNFIFFMSPFLFVISETVPSPNTFLQWKGREFFSPTVLIPASFCFKIYWTPSTWPDAESENIKEEDGRFPRKVVKLNFEE